MAEANVVQQDNFEKLTRMMTNFRKDSKERHSYGYFKARQQRLAEIWTMITTSHQAILSGGKLTSEHQRQYSLEYDRVEEIYLELLSIFETGVKEHTSLTSTATASNTINETTSGSNRIRLERITIPQFDGNYGRWRTFHDLFTSMVHHSEGLSAVEKMQYLKTHLTGEAARVVQHLDISNENYEAAWELLNERFDNKKAIAWNHMHKFYHLAAAKEERDSAVKYLVDATAEFLANMKGIGINVDNWDAIIIYMISQKLDIQSRRLWEASLGSCSDIPKLETFMDFLTGRFRALEALGTTKRTGKVDSLIANEATVCTFCQKDHFSTQCSMFKTLSVSQRRNLIQERSACYNCLQKGHNVKSCPSKNRCRMCNKKHHTLLHSNDSDDKTKGKEATKQSAPATTTLMANQTEASRTVLLARARLKVRDRVGHLTTLRALIDCGSQRSFITEKAVQSLGIERQYASFSISGLGSKSSIRTRGEIELLIQPKFGDEINISALIISKITNVCPAVETKTELPAHCNLRDLADPDYGVPGNIDVLLGADVYGLFVLPEFKQGTPCALKTRLGWVLLSPTYTKSPNADIIAMVSTEDTADKLLRKFWELEEVPTVNHMTKEEEAAVNWYRRTTRREKSGRYVVRLPFKTEGEPTKALRDSQKAAHIQFSRLERRLMGNKELRSQYTAFIQEYIDLGHMTEVSPKEIYSSYNYYMPHHAVCKEDSTTTKLRVVFNASQAAPSGKSLNDVLLVGPSIQNNLATIIMKWRTLKYVIAADTEKMYRQILVHEDDRDYQRILWRNLPSDAIKHYRLNTVTYGTASAPFLAIQTLHKLAEDESLYYPKACETIKQEFYVDEVFTGGDSLREVKQLQQDLITVLHKGGFHLRKWTANHESLLETICPADRETQIPLKLTLTDNIKALGLQWNPAKDTFTFKVCLQGNKDTLITKRQILSETSQLFDPIGWVQPCIILGKIIMQQLWLKKTGWDEPIDNELEIKWRSLRNQLELLQQLSIPRWLGYSKNEILEVHGFCDASESAYAAVIYARIQHSNGDITTRLLTSKSKVAPLKILSIPRLELCGAVLLTQLMKATLEAHCWSHVTPSYWTDSTIVLQWIQNQPVKWKTFVANRVSQIQTDSDLKQWEHVPSTTNPADIASRGSLPQDLLENKLWWEGPAWLREDSSKWPRSKGCENKAAVNIELRSNTIACFTTSKEHEKIDLIEKFSSLSKLVRVIAYCRRWKNRPTTSFLSAEELRDAELVCVRLVQRETFPNEIKSLTKRHPLPKSSSLIRLTPFIDSNQLMRMTGRLQHSASDPDKKHPIILPRGHLANLIIKHYHHLTLHGGAQLVHATIREKYWIINGLTAVKAVTRKCVRCFKTTAKPEQQLMGQLPSERVTPGKPFAQSGIDYAGPITIKWSSGRGAKTTKAYIVVFICLSTKAVHLELASDLTAKTCIAAIRRFIARRGMCHTLMSDNGTNFVSADKTLRRDVLNMISEAQKTLAINNINWKFIPPGSPHFGGIWEAAVKSMKRHLFKVIGCTLLNVEEMYTLLAQIEACMNSRPLTPISSDPNDFAVLTPGHFLTGQSLFELPDGNTEDSLSKKWQMIQSMKRLFWQRWSLEHLTQLQQRSKWFSQNRRLNVGDLVLIKHENQPSLHWPMGRVTAIHLGKDNLARVVTIKTATGTLDRSLAKICPLPNDDQPSAATR